MLDLPQIPTPDDPKLHLLVNCQLVSTCPSSAGLSRRTSQKSPQHDGELQRKLQILQKYRIEASDLAEVLDDLGPEMLNHHANF